jgi:hypothetical protein
MIFVDYLEISKKCHKDDIKDARAKLYLIIEKINITFKYFFFLVLEEIKLKNYDVDIVKMEKKKLSMFEIIELKNKKHLVEKKQIILQKTRVKITKLFTSYKKMYLYNKNNLNIFQTKFENYKNDF